MFIYRFEANLIDRSVPIVIVASTDESAFNYVEIELEKHYLTVPIIEDITLIEKRKIRHGGGYILDPNINR